MTESTLDSLLQDWTVRHSLPTARAEAIRNRILTTPPVVTTALPTGWWHDFSGTLNTTLQQPVLFSPNKWRSLSMPAH